MFNNRSNNNQNNIAKAFRPKPFGSAHGVKFGPFGQGPVRNNQNLVAALKGIQEDGGVEEPSFDPINQVARQVSYPRRGQSNTVQAFNGRGNRRRQQANTRVGSKPAYRGNAAFARPQANTPWAQPQNTAPWAQPQSNTAPWAQSNQQTDAVESQSILVFGNRGADNYAFENNKSCVFSFILNENTPNGEPGQWIDVVVPMRGLGIHDGGEGFANSLDLVPAGVGCSMYIYPVVDELGEQQYSSNGSPKFWGNYVYVNYQKGNRGVKWEADFNAGWKAQR